MASRRAGLCLAAILAGSFLVKAQLIAFVTGTTLVWDEADYWRIALVLAEHGLDPGAYPGSYRMPGYPYFLAGCALVSGNNLAVARVAQVLVSLASAGLLFGLVRSRWGDRAGLFAAAALSFLPELAGFTVMLWPETLFIALLVPSLGLLARAHATGSIGAAAVAGILLGLGVLTKSSYAAYLPLASALLAVVGPAPARRRALVAGAFAAACLATLSPWLVRNYRHTGRPSLASHFWINVWAGNREPGTAVYRRYLAIEDETAREQLARREGMAWIRAQGWRWPFLKVARNLPMLLGPGNTATRNIWIGAYGTVPRGPVRALVAASVLGYLAIMVLAILGFAREPWQPLKLHALALALPIVATHLVLLSGSRFREPLMVPAVIFAAAAVAASATELAVTARRWPVVVGLALLAACASVSVENRHLHDLWWGRTFADRVQRGVGPDAGP